MKAYRLGLLLFPLIVFAGCSAAGGVQGPAAVFRSGNYGASAASGAGAAAARAEEAGGQYREDAEQDLPADTSLPRKLVKQANLSVRVANLEEADASVQALLVQHSGAYAASTETAENSRAYRIRVPAASYDGFLAALDGMGRTLRRFESAEDVTLRYFDLEGRLATKQELLKTFQSYLGKAKDIEEILSVETRIMELQDEIDGTGKELRRLANLVDYATIELNLYGPVASTPSSGPTPGERVRELFGGFGDFASTVLVVLTGIVIYGIPVILLLSLLFWLLFGRIGLIKKLWRLAAGRNSAGGNGVDRPAAGTAAAEAAAEQGKTGR
jgi:hypothetical protein